MLDIDVVDVDGHIWNTVEGSWVVCVFVLTLLIVAGMLTGCFC